MSSSEIQLNWLLVGSLNIKKINNRSWFAQCAPHKLILVLRSPHQSLQLSATTMLDVITVFFEEYYCGFAFCEPLREETGWKTLPLDLFASLANCHRTKRSLRSRTLTNILGITSEGYLIRSFVRVRYSEVSRSSSDCVQVSKPADSLDKAL